MTSHYLKEDVKKIFKMTVQKGEEGSNAIKMCVMSFVDEILYRRLFASYSIIQVNLF